MRQLPECERAWDAGRGLTPPPRPPTPCLARLWSGHPDGRPARDAPTVPTGPAVLARTARAQRPTAPPQALRHLVHPKGVSAKRFCDLRLGERPPLSQEGEHRLIQTIQRLRRNRSHGESSRAAVTA